MIDKDREDMAAWDRLEAEEGDLLPKMSHAAYMRLQADLLSKVKYYPRKSDHFYKPVRVMRETIELIKEI